jgi:hypothetical protein
MSTWSALLFVYRFILSPAMTRKSVRACRMQEDKGNKKKEKKEKKTCQNVVFLSRMFVVL